MGKVNSLKMGKYLADVYDHYGKRQRRVFETYKDANDYVIMLENDKREHRKVVLGLTTRRSTIENSINEFLLTKSETKPKSLNSYKHKLIQFQIFCNEKSIKYTKDFNRDHADEFWKELKEFGAAVKTTNFYLMTVKALFTHEVERDRLVKNPFSHVKTLKGKVKTQIEREEEYYDTDEIKSYFQSTMSKVDRQVFTVLYLTGMRISELQNLKLEYSIDMTEKIIKVRNFPGYVTKTPSSVRDIPMTDTVYKIIKALKGSKEEGYVFLTTKGKQISERTYLDKCKRIAKKAGINKNATLHSFRHSFSSHVLNTEVKYEEKQYVLGHAPESMSDRYTKVDPKTLHAKLSALDKLIK